MNRKRKNSFAFIGIGILIFFIFASFFSFLYPVDPNTLHMTNRFASPSLFHPFGTDEMGRDYFARCLYGGRASLLIGFMAMILSTFIGVTVGSISGFLGGKTDALLMRLVDIFMSLPTFLIMVVMNAYLKPGILNVIFIIGFLSWMSIARIVRGETLSLKEREYVIYSKISGQKRWKIIWYHILPNIMPTILVAATMNIASAILMESSLSFLGLGIRPPTASWGSMLSNAQSYLIEAPHLAVFPGVFIFLTVISFYYIGEILKKIWEPK